MKDPIIDTEIFIKIIYSCGILSLFLAFELVFFQFQLFQLFLLLQTIQLVFVVYKKRKKTKSKIYFKR